MTARPHHGPPRAAYLIAILAALVLAAALGIGLLGGSSPDPDPTTGGGPSDGGTSDGGAEAPDPTAAPQDPSADPTDGSGAEDSPVADSAPRTERCPEATTTVEDSAELRAALESARPGDVIHLAAGTYEGEFTAQAAGTSDAPITLCGEQDAVLDGGEPDGGYTLHLDGAAHWHLLGFSVTGGQKGVMLDGTEHSVIEGLTVTDTGDEAIHLRAHSSHNTVVGNHVSGTGLRKPKYGEGIYIGSAESNWEELTGGEPDTSDHNLVEDNRIEEVTAEAVDIKEGTTGGILRNNSFDGSAIAGDDHADSWVDVKGNDWLIEGNTGASAPADGFQTHEILDGWGTGNVFRHNTADMTGTPDAADGGHGFALTPELTNVVECSNDISGADRDLATTDCVEDAETP